jgi:hypothetical protein
MAPSAANIQCVAGLGELFGFGGLLDDRGSAAGRENVPSDDPGDGALYDTGSSAAASATRQLP